MIIIIVVIKNEIFDKLQSFKFVKKGCLSIIYRLYDVDVGTIRIPLTHSPFVTQTGVDFSNFSGSVNLDFLIAYSCAEV